MSLDMDVRKIWWKLSVIHLNKKPYIKYVGVGGGGFLWGS